jgi:hypothetical protein
VGCDVSQVFVGLIRVLGENEGFNFRGIGIS